ncbi:MAG: hypothetical protein K2H55_04010 [Helicobacter sp.]|nr:hypothetical protein [Helicobacter sp.]MDE6044461.1 hypothetical protein [Helicobacter sp.]MDE7196597.1 hypothetical protein [Helicobacter sp.]
MGLAFSGNYQLDTIISAFITFGVIMLTVRVYLKYVAKKRPQIQRPDWLKERKPRTPGQRRR